MSFSCALKTLFHSAFPLLILCSSLAADPPATPIVRQGNPAAVTHTFKIRDITFGFSDQGGGYLNFVDFGDGKNAVPAFFGRGWQGSVRDQLHSGRYNPTQAGFRDYAGAPVTLTATEHSLTIPRFQLPLYGDPVFDFTEHEDLAPDFKGYKDNGNSDTDGLEETGLSQDEELRSEFDFEGLYEDATALAGGTIPVLRFYSRYTYARDPKSILQFGKKALLADGKPVLVESARTQDISPALMGSQTAKDEDLSQIIFTAYGIRLTPESGYTTPLWIEQGKWTGASLETVKGWDKERKFFLPIPSVEENAAEETLEYPFLVLAKGDNPDTSPAVGLYTPSKSEINTHQILGLDKTSGKIVYREDRRTKSFLVLSHVVSTQAALLSRFFLTGMLAPGHGRPNVLEALQNESFVLFGTPNQIRDCVANLERKLNDVRLPGRTTGTLPENPPLSRNSPVR